MRLALAIAALIALASCLKPEMNGWKPLTRCYSDPPKDEAKCELFPTIPVRHINAPVRTEDC